VLVRPRATILCATPGSPTSYIQSSASLRFQRPYYCVDVANRGMNPRGDIKPRRFPAFSHPALFVALFVALVRLYSPIIASPPFCTYDRPYLSLVVTNTSRHSHLSAPCRPLASFF
jgi:hypothetical protein